MQEIKQIKKDQASYSTRQWVEVEVFNAFEKCAKYHPEVGVTVSAFEYDDKFVNVLINAPNTPGRVIFSRKLVNFVVLAMRIYYRNITELPAILSDTLPPTK
jgi:hypothetical protein